MKILQHRNSHLVGRVKELYLKFEAFSASEIFWGTRNASSQTDPPPSLADSPKTGMSPSLRGISLVPQYPDSSEDGSALEMPVLGLENVEETTPTENVGLLQAAINKSGCLTESPDSPEELSTPAVSPMSAHPDCRADHLSGEAVGHAGPMEDWDMEKDSEFDPSIFINEVEDNSEITSTSQIPLGSPLLIPLGVKL